MIIVWISEHHRNVPGVSVLRVLAFPSTSVRLTVLHRSVYLTYRACTLVLQGSAFPEKQWLPFGVAGIRLSDGDCGAGTQSWLQHCRGTHTACTCPLLTCTHATAFVYFDSKPLTNAIMLMNPRSLKALSDVQTLWKCRFCCPARLLLIAGCGDVRFACPSLFSCVFANTTENHMKSSQWMT